MASHLGWRGVGTGIVYNGALTEDLVTDPGMVDAISLVPEMLWYESSNPRRYRWTTPAVELFDAALGRTPLVFHGIGLSLGSGLPLDHEHLDQVAAAVERYRPLWYSEHLAAFRVGRGSGGRTRAGVGLPVPLDRATLNQLVPKVAGVVSRLGLPVLLENSAIYVEVPGAEMSEAAFLNRLCDETGAHVLLDLHNLMVNEVNLGWHAEDYLAELDLARIVEIHVAGGEMLGNWYTDAHSGACPERVWELLDSVVPAAPMLQLITFEVHESRLERLGTAGLRTELSRIRSSIGAVVSDIS
jgi:uncharacterized protein (UPF0276 family)